MEGGSEAVGGGVEDRHLEEGERERAGHRDEEGGVQPQCPAGVERTEADASHPAMLVEEERGDEEAREHEEHIDPGPTTDEAREAGVVAEHEEDGGRPQAVERSNMAEASSALDLRRGCSDAHGTLIHATG